MSTDLHFASQTEADIYLLETQIAAVCDSPRHNTRYHARNGYTVHHLANLRRIRDSLHAPVYKLPDDVLSHLFKMCAVTTGRLDTAVSVTLSQVVSRWRRVALSTPSLWTSVDVFLPMTNADSQKCKAFFDRSANHLVKLSVKVSEAQIGPFRFEDQKLDFMQLLKHCDTLQISPSLTYSRDLSSLTRISYSLIPPTLPSTTVLPLSALILWESKFSTLADFLILLQMFPHLRLLELCYVDVRQVEPFTPDVIELPVLTQLCLDHFCIRGRSSITPTPFDYVRTPELHDLTLQSFETFGQPCTSPNLSNVTTLRLNANGNRVLYARLIPTICGMPSLRSLSMNLRITAESSELPQGLRLPHLETIDFINSRGVDKLALWLVQNTTSGGTSTASLKTVAAYSYNGVSWVHIPEEILLFIQGRVPHVQLTRTHRRTSARKS